MEMQYNKEATKCATQTNQVQRLSVHNCESIIVI